MRILRTYCWLAILVSGCGSSTAATPRSDSGSGGGAGLGTTSSSGSSSGSTSGSRSSSAGTTSCTGQEAVCPSVAYGLCCQVQMALGHCVDWSKVGATLCVSPADCPATQPTAQFATEANPAAAICVKASAVEYTPTDNSTDTGYCAAIQTAIDPTGVADCSTDPCGSSATNPGYCSYVRNKSSATVVSCTWPI